MLALDLFNTPFERALNEGAVDDLEARRIHHLNTRMLELMSRANDADFKASPEGLAGLKREYQKLKDERDGYYKIREAGIPGNVPVEKIPGKEDLLKGRGRTYYEGQESEAGGIGDTETSKNWLYQQTSASGMPNIVTDAKGRTQQQWIKLVQSKFPTAKILQAKMINGPVFATLPDGRKISWTKVETSNNQTKIDEDDASDAVARNLERKLYSRIFGVDPDELIQRDAIRQQDREYSLAAGTEKRLELKLKADQIKEIKLEKLRNERLEDEENAFRRYEIQAQRRDAMEKIRRAYEHELKMINAEHSNNLEIVKTGNNHEIQKLNMEYAEVEKDRAERRQDREDSRRQQSAQADQPEQPTKPEQSSPGSDRARTKPASSSTPAAEPRPMRDMGRAQEVRPGLGKPDLPRLAKESQKKNSALGEKKLGQLRPSLGTGHDIGRSVKKFRTQRGLDEGQVSDEVDHRGDVDTSANIEVLGVDLNDDTFKITYNKKPYQVKIQNFSQEGLGRWQIADYDVDIINSKEKNIIDLIDWDNDRQVKMVNTIIAYLDTQQAGDIQLMSWRQVGMANSTAEDLYQEIQEFYKNDKQQIDKATAWLAQNIEDAEERQVFADFVKNPVSRPARTKYIPKEYLMYVAFSYSREGNTELTPGMNLKTIQLDDPDDEEELQRKVDELIKKVQFKFDAFENKIVELADSYGLGSDPDLGSGFGQREIVWDHKTMTTSSSESNKNRQQILAKGILNFQAELKKYVASFNNTLIKIGLPGIGEYSTWSGVLGDQLTDQQVRYFATPEGFANLASGKIDVAKMLDDNVDKQGVAEHGGGMGRSVKKFRAQRGLDEKGTGPLDQKLQRLKVQARRQFPRAHTDDEALVLKLLDKETQDDQANRRTDARQDAELRKNFALDREQEDEIDNLQAQVGVKEHGGGIGPRQRWQDLMPEQYTNDEDYEDEEDQDTELRSGDYVRDTMDGESGEIFRMQGDPYERRVRILDRDGKGWYIEPGRLTRVDPQDPDIQRYFGKQRVRDMDEMDKSQPSHERHGDRPLGAKGTTAKPVAAQKVVKDLAMDLDQAFAKEKPVKKKGVAEGSKPGEYYIHTVYFKDGTKKRIRVTSDEFDVADYYTKRGQAVDRVDYDFQLHSDMTEARAAKTRLDKTHNNLTESKTYKLWESAGRKIVEAQLTVAQIQQIFQQAEQGATAAGANRTGLGQVKDAGSAVAQAWAQLKTKVANSGPVKNVDAYYDQAAEKLRQATGGDQGVMRYVEKYRTFAKAHPVAQSLIYSALIAAAGISGAGAGGAAALALLKLTDKLLQGEKFSSAAYSGAKTGALAYGASLLKDLMSGTQGVTTSVEDPEWEKLRFQGDLVSVNQVVTTTNGTSTFKEVIQSIVGPNAKGEYLVTIVNNDDLREFVTKTPPPSVATGATESKKYSKSKLTETQIKRVFQVAGHMQDQLNEGMWDNVKNTAKGLANKAAGAVVNKAQTIGTNLTTKVTADKLMTAWKKAGSPLDSEQVKVIMKQSGVADNIIVATMPAQTTTAPVQRVAASNPTQPMPATVAEDQDTSGVERAILNRIMVAHTDLLMKFGPDKVMQAAEEVAYNVGDVDEIGTSDVSAYVAQVKQILGATP